MFMFARIRFAQLERIQAMYCSGINPFTQKAMLYVLFLCLQTNLFLRTKCKLKSSIVEAHIAMYMRQQSANNIQRQSFRKSFRSGKASELNLLTNLLKCLLYCFHLLLWHFKCTYLWYLLLCSINYIMIEHLHRNHLYFFNFQITVYHKAHLQLAKFICKSLMPNLSKSYVRV